MNNYGSPKIVVSLGTDHHAFDRLVSWTDEWLEQQAAPPSCLVQHGASRPPRRAPGVTMVSHQEILDLYADAEVIVVQGGPGSIIDALSTGHIPIAVPRRSQLHEVVDDHQVEFAQQMARQGQAVLADKGRPVDGARARAAPSGGLSRSPAAFRVYQRRFAACPGG